jgi:hypothetical protein
LLLGFARAVTLGSKSHRTHGHILLSHLRLPQPGGPCPHIYITQEQGGPVIFPGTGFGKRVRVQIYVFMLLIPFLQVNMRVKGLKRQLDEAEEEISREKAQKRKAQRDMEDMMESHEAMSRELANLKNKLR